MIDFNKIADLAGGFSTYTKTMKSINANKSNGKNHKQQGNSGETSRGSKAKLEEATITLAKYFVDDFWI
jgi:hypothetical protein